MNDKQTGEEKGIKVHKLPTESHEQAETTKEIQRLWGKLEQDLCTAIQQRGVEMSKILGSKFYQ